MLHPREKPRRSYLETTVEGVEGPFVAASDYVRAHSEQISPWLPDMFALGTDGMGRSETREALRRHFEVDAEFVTIAAMYQLSQIGKLDSSDVTKAIKALKIDPDKISPLYA
jgi:pyruvate dehydrogenase E1 component